MRTVWGSLAVIVLLLGASRAEAQSSERRSSVQSVGDALQLDDKMTQRLLTIMTIYDREREALQAKDVELRDAIRVTTDPVAADKLLDQRLALQRQVVAHEQKLVRKLRAILRPVQATRARVMLLGPVDPLATGGGPSNTAAIAAPPAVTTIRRGGDLFPPGSQLGVEAIVATPDPTRCDPFAQMHGCRRSH